MTKQCVVVVVVTDIIAVVAATAAAAASTFNAKKLEYECLRMYALRHGMEGEWHRQVQK